MSGLRETGRAITGGELEVNRRKRGTGAAKNISKSH